MVKIIRAGYVEDAKTYVNGIISMTCNSELEIVQNVAGFIDGLKKGWHVDAIKTRDSGDIEITVVKKD